MQTTDERWITDANGNRCSVEYFGSREAAQAALDSLKNCHNTTDCSDCSDCSRCSDCSEKKGDEHSVTIPTIPTINDIDKAVYAAVTQTGALDMTNWHTCETTHCRAGWVVTLAGDAGKALEARFNTELAALLIYRESGSPINPCRFYDPYDKAMADMKRRAEVVA